MWSSDSTVTVCACVPVPMSSTILRQYIALKRAAMGAGPLHHDASGLLSNVSEEQMLANRSHAKTSAMVVSLQRICPGFEPPTAAAKPVSKTKLRAKNLWAAATSKVVAKIREDHPCTWATGLQSSLSQAVVVVVVVAAAVVVGW